MSTPRYAYDVDTAVEAVADHRFAAAITDRWNVLGGRPNGGDVMGICLPWWPSPASSRCSRSAAPAVL